MSDHDELRTRVLILGAGAAGLRAAIELVERGVDCLVLGKRAHGDAHTRWAAGGINASLGTRDPEDGWEIHFADTVREGHLVCDPRAVEILCRDAPERVRELRRWGCPFNETEGGEIDQRYFGAQSFRRTCFVGDRTGEAILATLVERAGGLGVPYLENVFVTRILLDRGGAVGALGVELASGRFLVIRAAAVVLAAGGYTSLYRRGTSRRDENNGDAVALALAAGATVRDMEFVQFHPTGMVDPPGMRGRLVTEAVRGEGGRLFNASGERFMERYSPEQMELDARDVVARAIYTEIREGRGTESGAVLLDISHRDPDFIRERLPKIAEQFREHGVDITRERMAVAPTAHYSMGGIAVDFDTGATTVEGLYAIGEATAGVHGANRLGGNSLAETVVFGQITGGFLADELGGAIAPTPAGADVSEHFRELRELRRSTGALDPETLVSDVRDLLWDHAGVVRSGEGLTAGIDRLAELMARANDLAVDGSREDSFLWALNLRFLLPAAEAVLRSALHRSESRGAHHRSDMPREEDGWRRSIVCSKGGDETIRLWTAPIPEVPQRLQAALDAERKLDYHHLE
jgi:succinate dehydrogenase / fumarate reductase, flavoprotein subunit